MSTSGIMSQFRRAAALALAVACVLPLCAARADDGRTKGVLQWQSGAVTTASQGAEQIAQAVDAARGAADKRYVVQLERPLDDSLRTSLELAGVKLLSYVGDNAFFARVDAARASGAGVGAIPDIRCVLPVQRNWKLHPDIVANRFPNYAISVAKDSEDARSYEPTVAVYVMLHQDANLREGIEMVQQYGGTVRSSASIVNGLIAELPLSALPSLAEEGAVQWIEPPLPAFQELNNSNRARVGADTVQGPPYGLDGTGVMALVYDGGKVRNTHQDLAGRVTIGDPSDTVSDHSTHVMGTIGGAGIANPLYKGMAPGTTFISHQFELLSGPLQQGFLYTDFGDLALEYASSIAAGADIANNSIGTNTVPNGYPCEWEGNYGITDTVIDTIVRGSGTDPNFPQFNTPFRVVWANGNERQGTRCNDPAVPAGYHLTAPPACAKNHITVGALNSNDDSMTTFSSWGPADDGRIKPDISAPGCQSNDDNDVTSCSSSSDTAYAGKCGTSMACPTTVGVSALILQDYRQQYPGQPDFRNSTLKTILAHTAVDVFEPGPDYKSGYGSIRVEPAIQLVRAGNFLENTISGTGALFTATVVVGPGQAPLKVTLAWDDVPGTPNVNPVLVNDLDLRVFDAQNNQYFPWTLAGLANPAAPAVRTQRNSVDNIEQVVIDAPAPGGYRIEVYGFNVPQGPQPFSLTATPLLVNCSSQGAASLDRQKYPCASTATARVIDCDLNTSDLVIDTVTVNIKSTTDPVGLSVLLTEVAPEAATFVGSVGLNTTGGPGVLQVAAGDTVTLTYNDADDGNGQPAVVTINAAIDCVGPVVSNVAVSPINPRDATVTFNTNENAKVTIRYGLDCGLLDQAKIVGGYRTAHSVVLDGLQDNTPYFFAIDVEDEAGNPATDNNGGACYNFATPEVPDFFTEDFTSAPTNDLDNISLIWNPIGGIDVYSLCLETALTELPNDPNAGLTFPSAFTDDSFRTINLTGGFTVSLYGVAYNTVHVGSNGYLTFTAGDTDLSETLADHFDTPRVSALFDDLNPTQGGGRITYQQLPDRLVVSFVNVPEHNVANTPNTFQFEMYGDGTIKIHYLTVTATDGLAGLSAGLGVSPDFLESDLTEYGGCSATFSLAAVPPVATVCAPANSVHSINVGVIEGFSDPVTLSIPNLPAGINASFVPNPVIPGNASTLTLDVTGAAAPATTNLQIQGVSGAITRNAYIGLTVYTAAPAAPVLIAPADGANGVALNPTFSWNAAAQAATYAIEVATDSGFANIVASASNLAATTWPAPAPLADGTAYFWHVRATNFCGNGAWSPTFSFTTQVVPDYFTQNFDTTDNNDLDNISLVWTPNGSIDYYALCNEALPGALPNDPNTGTSLGFTATASFKTITLTGGATVKLYGAAYSTVHVGACGYLTFTAGDTDTTETLADHFDTPRVSALFDSLSPQLAGAQATWQQFADKLVVSFVNVKETSTSTEANTFQYEMFFDGTIKIHYKTIGAVDGITGLSQGNGLPSPFFESNLNGYGACGPRPPTAVAQQVNTPVNVNANITLEGTDDGLPDPPAALSYIIVSLPADGQLLDPGAGAITTVPYTLVGGGNVVVYDPAYNYQGSTNFTFKINDGGVPPEGGDSASAIVAVMVGGPQAVYSFPLDTNPGWGVQDQWAFGVPQGLSGDPASGYTGQNVYGFNLAGDYPNGMTQTYYLTSEALDFTDVTQVSLRFRRWLGVERSQYDFATIDVSNDNGTTWTNVWTNPQPTGQSINEAAWSYQIYDISAAADGHAQVRVRWGMGPTDTSVVYHGWNLDDIEFWALVPLGPGICLGDVDCSGAVDFFDIDPFVARIGCPSGGNCGGECPWQNADIDENGSVDFFDIDPFVARIGATCN